jgi:hypothetical protein
MCLEDIYVPHALSEMIKLILNDLVTAVLNH